MMSHLGIYIYFIYLIVSSIRIHIHVDTYDEWLSAAGDGMRQQESGASFGENEAADIPAKQTSVCLGSWCDEYHILFLFFFRHLF